MQYPCKIKQNPGQPSADPWIVP